MSEPEELRALPGLGCAWAVIGAIAVALLLFIAVGLALPGTWTVERTRSIDAPVDAVFPLLADLQSWETWTHWPELQGRTDGPSTGVGASRSWDDPNYGRGALTITNVAPGASVSYEVVVDEGAMRVQGTLSARAEGGATMVTWREEGDFGWNPLLAYMALTMDRMQGSELEKSLDRLATVATGGTVDSVPPR